MGACETVRPLLYQYIERETAPAEAMVVANHLSECTACKILLARKRRLARILEEGLDDDICVGEDFVRSVMKTLPDGPPPVVDRRKIRNRGLKLAGIVALLFGLGQAAAGRLPVTGSPHAAIAIPGIDGPAADRAFQGLAELVHWSLVAIQVLTHRLPVDGSLPTVGLGLTVSLLAALMLGVLGSSAVVAVLAWRWIRTHGI